MEGTIADSLDAIGGRFDGFGDFFKGFLSDLNRTLLQYALKDLGVTGKGGILDGLFGSIGGLFGGGGSGGSSLAVTVTPGSLLALSSSIGGSGGSGGNAYGVRINNDGLISTYNTQASAIVGQSIGGGGGNGGNSFAAGASLGVSGVLSVGGSGGSGGNADYVDITNTGALQTLGGGAAAVLAQSIGGGGGNGGTSLSDFIGFMTGGGISVGGTGGNGGTSGNVTVNNYGSIAANNSYALNNATGATAIGNNPGILAQSIGGGGGNAGYAVGGADAAYAATFAIGTSGGNGGDSLNVQYALNIENKGIIAGGSGGGGGSGGASRISFSKSVFIPLGLVETQSEYEDAGAGI